MRCEEARPLISVGLDGELEDGRAALLCQHLTQCMPCRTEREALAGTIRVLHALPEAEPPVELRRRIGVALLEEERRAQRRHLGWTWLARPQSAGWAWGAAFGAIAATVALVMTHGPYHRAHLVAASLPPVRPAVTPASSVGTRPLVKVMPPPAVTKLAAHPTQKLDAQGGTAELPVPRNQPTVAPPPLSTVASASRVARKLSSSITPRPHRQPPAVRTVPPDPTASLLARGPSSRQDKAISRPGSSDRESPRTVRMDPPDTADPPAPDTQNSEDRSDTSGMTQMTSSLMSSQPVEVKDDLAALRHRLTDRPLQVPELGQVKPATSNGAGRDGWIRF